MPSTTVPSHTNHFTVVYHVKKTSPPAMDLSVSVVFVECRRYSRFFSGLQRFAPLWMSIFSVRMQLELTLIIAAHITSGFRITARTRIPINC